jgi:hypothetical protein
VSTRKSEKDFKLYRCLAAKVKVKFCLVSVLTGKIVTSMMTVKQMARLGGLARARALSAARRREIAAMGTPARMRKAATRSKPRELVSTNSS